MKNIKIILSLLPVIAISLMIYFFSSGYANSKTSSGVTVHLLNATAYDCLGGDYTYCINGSHPIEVHGDFKIDIECNEYVEICVHSKSGCAGSWAGYFSCVATPDIYIYLSNIAANCSCD
ncbi:MAG: hypothetical protein J0M18_05835 [Ignavibacteria bacterium]|nr:hypothetical protein [Ignavibacteria bacterium]